MIQRTSVQSFHEEKDSLRLGERQQLVYNLIRRFPGKTDRELALIFAAQIGHPVDPNVIRPRRHELVEKGLVELFEKRECKVTGKTSMTWKIVSHQMQRELFSDS